MIAFVEDPDGYKIELIERELSMLDGGAPGLLGRRRVPRSA